MRDPIIPEIPTAITDASQGAAMAPQTEEDAIKPLTGEVDTDDMFNQDPARQPG